MGVSTHTPNLEEVANTAIDSGRFDVMMLAYHFGMWPSFGHILQKAKEHDVGIVAMKTLKGAKHEHLAGFGDDAPSERGHKVVTTSAGARSAADAS